MPTVLHERVCPAQHDEKRIPVTRRAADDMRENGEIVGRYELIDGEIISKMGQKPLHAYVVSRLTDLLVFLFGKGRVRIQLPMRVAHPDSLINEPEPDAAVLAKPAESYLTENPGPPDVLVVFEVADTTLLRDLGIKAQLYARASVVQYIVIDLPGRQILVHDGPTNDGYERITAYTEPETFALTMKPEELIAVAELLPPEVAADGRGE